MQSTTKPDGEDIRGRAFASFADFDFTQSVASIVDLVFLFGLSHSAFFAKPVEDKQLKQKHRHDECQTAEKTLIPRNFCIEMRSRHNRPIQPFQTPKEHVSQDFPKRQRHITHFLFKSYHTPENKNVSRGVWSFRSNRNLHSKKKTTETSSRSSFANLF